MSVYRFRVTFEEFEDVSRDIDIRADQSLQELQQAILESVTFDQKHGSAWFKSDDMWRKGKLLEQLERAHEGKEEHPLKKHPLARLITNPHQKFLFIYDLLEEWVFTVELVRIVQPDKKTSYPGITRKSGIPPKQYKLVLTTSVTRDEDEDEEKPAKKSAKGSKPSVKAAPPVKAPLPEPTEEDEEPDDEELAEESVFTATAEGYDEEEVNSLEGEEGEESEEQGDDEYGDGEDDYRQDDDGYGGYGRGGDDDDRY